MSNTEPTCASCTHSEVCKHKENYLKVCDAASNINVTLNEYYLDGVRAKRIPVTNFDCIEGIEVHCKYYLRASDISSTCTPLEGSDLTLKINPINKE